MITVGWSPSSDNNGAGVGKPSQEQTPGMFSHPLVEKLMQCNDEDGTIGRMLGELMKWEECAKELIADNNAGRVEQLQTELEQVCALGRDAQLAVLNAKNNELIVRNSDAQRTNSYNRTSRALNNARGATLPAFYDAVDVERKNAAIERAQADYDTVLADMNAHPNSIPAAVQLVHQSQRTLSDLVARERTLRREIATLTGQPAHSVGGAVSETGLSV